HLRPRHLHDGGAKRLDPSPDGAGEIGADSSRLECRAEDGQECVEVDVLDPEPVVSRSHVATAPATGRVTEQRAQVLHELELEPCSGPVIEEPAETLIREKPLVEARDHDLQCIATTELTEQ